MDLTISKFPTRDGTELYFEHWRPKKLEGAFVFVHGVGDHIGRYRRFADYFSQRNYLVCLFDMRGHGRSPGRRCYVKRFEQYFEDLEDFIQFSRESATGVPWYLVGHSFGGQIALNHLVRHQNFFQAACVTSPNLHIAITMPKWQENIARSLVPILPGKKLDGLTDPAKLSHNPKILEDYLKDPFVSSFVTLRQGKGIYDNIPELFSKVDRIKTPLLMLHGTDDVYCSYEGTKKFFVALKLAKKQLKLYEGMYHELLQEVIHEEVFQEIRSWFDANRKIGV